MAKLTHTSIKNAKPKGKPYKLVDGGGMYLLVNRSGKYWRVNYRYAGKQKTLALGVYPEISLMEARQRRDEAKKQLANDLDPQVEKQIRISDVRWKGICDLIFRYSRSGT